MTTENLRVNMKKALAVNLGEQMALIKFPKKIQIIIF